MEHYFTARELIIYEFTSGEIVFHWHCELKNWSRAVNSSWVRTARVLHFVIKDGGGWW